MGLLPTKKTKPTKVLENQTMLIFGSPKIGKSSFCAQMDSSLFLATEPGLNALEVYQTPIDSWEKFLEACAELAKDHNGFKNIIIDTIDNLYQFCEGYVLKKNGINHPSDMPYGKGFSLVNAEFGRVIKKLSLLPIGLVFVSHAKEKEIDSRIGKYLKTVPTLGAGASKIVLGLSDMILFFDTEQSEGKDGEVIERRIIRTKASKNYDAGSRWPIPDNINLNFADFKKAYEKGE